MAPVTFTISTQTPVDMVLGALTDFTDRRPALWPDLDPEAYRVEHLSEGFALAREGQRSPRLWALEEYDWSTPGVVRWTVRESNFCAPGSFMEARIEPDGTQTRVHITWDRTGVGFKGKLIVGMLRATRGKPLAASLSKAIDGLGARV